MGRQMGFMLQELEQWESDKKSIQTQDTDVSSDKTMDSTILNIYNTGYKDNAPITKSELWINKISTIPISSSMIKEI